jgi:hypothetical protein
MASRKLTDLSADMRPLAEAFIAECQRQGLDIVIICTYRDNIEQEAAYACGASRCRGGQSAHNQVDVLRRSAAEAFDVGVIRDGKYVGIGSDPDYLRAGEIGEALGLVWAGRWTGKIRETAHFQNAKWSKP